jgi:hypothetical protein
LPPLVPDPPVVNGGYRSTNYWLIGAGQRRIMVDLGWPGTFDAMRAQLGRAGVPLEAIRYALASALDSSLFTFHFSLFTLKECRTSSGPRVISTTARPASSKP